MKLVIPKGAAGRIVTVFIQANNVTTGAGLAGLTSASSIVGGYVREGAAGVGLAVDEAVASPGTYQAPSTAAHVRIAAVANMRAGTYELHFHNDLWATGAEAVTVTLGGAANMAELALEVQLSDPVRGLGSPTALPNAAANAAGGLPVSAAGALALDTLLGRLDAAITSRLATAGYTAPDNALIASIAGYLDTEMGAALAILQRTEVWQGTLSAIAAGSVTFPGGHGIDPNATVMIRLTGGTDANARSRFLVYSGAGNVWTPDPAWNVSGQPVPSGTVTAVVYAVAPSAVADLAALADAVWDELLAGHAGVGSAGAGLAAAGSGGDPWSSTTFGAAGAGTAGERLARVPNAAAGGAGGLPTVDGTNRVAGLVSAAQVRTELATELARIDAAITSRAAPGAAMTLTSGERTAIANEVETQIIDETDAEKVLLAITNKIAEANPDLSGLTLGAIGAAVRTALTTELARIDVAISTRLATAGYTAPPTAAANATQVRTELSVELARVDVGISTRAAPGAAMTLTGGERTSIATAILDAVYEGTRSLRAFLRLASSVLWGKSSGHAAGASSPVYRDQGDTKPRITATTDANGNRTAVTTDDA